MDINNENFKPFQPPTYELAEKTNRIIRMTNVLLISLIAIALWIVYISQSGFYPLQRLIRIHEATLSIVIPVYATIFPLIIARLYPKPAKYLKKDKGDLAFNARLNSIGAICLIMILNHLYLLSFDWKISVYIVLISAYLLSAILPLKPVIGSDIKPPSIWSFQENINKIFLLFFAVYSGGHMWGQILPPHDIFEHLGINNFTVSVLTMTLLIPFYISYFASSLPWANIKMTHVLDKEELVVRFR